MGVEVVGGKGEFAECSAPCEVWRGGGGCGLAGVMDQFGGVL